MKRTITILLYLIPLLAMAQEPQVIGGYLLDGKDSFEELDAAVLDESKSKEKNLDNKGMKIPGGCIAMNPRSVGTEIGSLVHTKQPFLVKTISFTVDENRMEGCKGSIRIYRLNDEGNPENIVTMPVLQDIPKAEKKTTFRIAPQESIVLEPGEYYISFSLTEISAGIMERWADSDTWTEKDRSTKYMEDRIFFPLYVKTSYTRKDADAPLSKWSANIGIAVRGIERKQ